jgi:RNA polymerase sigma-70 factor (ECF subfamily)
MHPMPCPLRLATDNTRDEATLRLERWLRDIARGDERALRAVIAATRDRLMSEAVRLLKSAECAEEVLQDTWLRVWNAAGGFDPRVSRPMTWLLRIVQNRAIDVLRSQRRQREARVDFDDALAARVPDASPGPEARLCEALRRRELQRSLAALSREQQQAMQLMLLRGYSHPEIAACCRVPESTARTWVRRGLMRLQADAGLRLAA